MPIGFCGKISMERNNVTQKVLLKLLNVFSGPFSIYKLFPSLEEIFERNDILIAMSELDSTHTSKYTPPPDLCPYFRKQRMLTFFGIPITKPYPKSTDAPLARELIL